MELQVAPRVLELPPDTAEKQVDYVVCADHCHDPALQHHERPNLTMNNLANSAKFTGGLGGRRVRPQDPDAADEHD